MRNDGISNKKKFLDINLHIKKALNDYRTIKVDKKKNQLYEWLDLVSYSGLSKVFVICRSSNNFMTSVLT